MLSEQRNQTYFIVDTAIYIATISFNSVLSYVCKCMLCVIKLYIKRHNIYRLWQAVLTFRKFFLAFVLELLQAHTHNQVQFHRRTVDLILIFIVWTLMNLHTPCAKHKQNANIYNIVDGTILGGMPLLFFVYLFIQFN